MLRVWLTGNGTTGEVTGEVLEGAHSVCWDAITAVDSLCTRMVRIEVGW